ncbi:hypothetical protein FOQG_18857 [Fusarium oxysporum f. sp. raphani 54005]|uniref:Uncharacterized protein n=1 Tax=Fusarium oxysporum f. sp. raphani 54005 TaxID=1089458 RepID=X0BD21_FUSOX|nr:hypothetical protein FOQG_18857 [Fusarium oxysporum f. sp. raphani 54005]
MSFATPGFDVLDRLALPIEPDAKVLICCRSTCRYALSVKGSAVTTHLRVKHQVEHDERKGLTEFLKSLGQSYLGDPSAAPLPKDGCSEHPDLRVYEGDAIQAHLTSIKEQGRLLKFDKNTPTHTESGGMRTNSQEDLLRFEEQTPWIERTGWDKTYHGRSRDALAALAAVSFSRGAGPHLLGRQGTNGLHEDIFSIMEDERKVAAVLEALDALLDRCEDTARKPSRSILCWLRSTHALAGYPKPFILPSSRRKYRVLFKRCLLLIFRSYRMDPSTRDKLTGIRFKRKQFRFLKAIWNHESLSDLDAQSPRTRLSLPGTETSYLGGFTQRCLSHNYSEDEREDDDEESVTESSEEDYEYWSDESQIVRHTGNEEPKGDEQVSQELIELLFGLSPSLCTEQVTNGQPSSTLLVFFSGILGFSSSSGAFLPAKLYTPYLSGLLYIQRLLFLEMALPLREYPTLELLQRPRTKQLERLEVVRKRYMVIGSQSAFEEMISLRSHTWALSFVRSFVRSV